MTTYRINQVQYNCTVLCNYITFHCPAHTVLWMKHRPQRTVQYQYDARFKT